MGCDASATELGLASFYGAQGLTAAHRSLPMGSRVKVLNLDNGRSVIVRIVDRGPFIRGRIIDVSTAAAVTLGFRDAGLAHVRIERISAETSEASAVPPRPAAPSSDETSSYAICRVGDRAAPLSGDAWGCDNFRLQLIRFAESTDDLTPVAALTKVGSGGVERVESIPVTGVAGMEAAKSIPVGALAEVLQREAPITRSASHCAAASCEAAERPRASNTVYSLFAELRRVFY